MITRFTAYRRALSERGTHSVSQANPDDQPQFEGVVFSDGSCVIKWLTAAKSEGIFRSLDDMLLIHGHPEYGTEIVWHDSAMPEEWERRLMHHAEHVQHSFHIEGFMDVTVAVERNESNEIIGIELHSMDDTIRRRIYPAKKAA